MGFGVQDHLSWPYDDRADYRRRVREFLSDGLALGLRCSYSADGPLELLEEDLAGIPHLQEEIARGSVILNVLGDLFPTGTVIDPGETLASFAAATDDALAAGYAGLRLAGDATPLVRTAEQLTAFAQWEHAADRYMTDHPLSALCAFDRTQLSAETTTALACLHPAARAGVTPFRVHSANHGSDVAVAGELDTTAVADFRACLDRIGLDFAGELVVDCTRLEFVDHRGLESIRDFASSSGATAVLRTSSRIPGRLIDLLAMEGIRAEPALNSGAL
jgi:anti-anti-sigma regulatory factor